MQLILALMLAVQSSVVLAATTANEESMDKAELFYKCLDDYGTRGASIEEEMQTRFFCKDKVDHTHHTPEQIVDEAKKGIADRHRRCAGAAQDDVSCMLWRYDPTSRLYIKCLALNGGRETDEVMNYCVIADREFRQCTQGNEGKVPSSVIEEYCLSGKVNGREVNVQRQATNSVEASRSPSNAKAQLPANNAASTGDFAKSFLAFLGAIYAIGTVGPILLTLVVLLIVAVLLLIGRVVSLLKWSSREAGQFLMLNELKTPSLIPMILRWILCLLGGLVAANLVSYLPGTEMEHQTVVSLVLGPVITYATFRWVRLAIHWRILITVGAMFLFLGIVGIVLNVCLAIFLAIAFFFGAPAIWLAGVVAIGVIFDVHYTELAWWKAFLICGAMGPVSMLLNLGITFGLLRIFASVKGSKSIATESWVPPDNARQVRDV